MSGAPDVRVDPTSKTAPDAATVTTGPATARTAEQTDGLAAWAHGLRWEQVPQHVRQRLRLALLDTLGVTIAGARTPGHRRLREVWPQPPGDAPVHGTDHRTQADPAAYLNATALVCCELDEGGKYARGHPAAHVFPAVLALAAQLGTDGPRTACALLAGYETAARFGRATRLRPGVHPHGNWGVAGAAAGCGILLGLSAPRLAAAIDTGAGLPVAGHFDSALDGHRVRDAWMGAAALSGLAAARLAQAGSVANSGTAALSLGTVLGAFDPEELTEGLGGRWEIEANYFKRHASCSYTHPAADLAAEVRRLRLPGRTPQQIAAAVRTVTVTTHALAAPLDRTRWDSALAAMFSLPYAVAAALLYGEVAPATAEATERTRPELFILARKVAVREDPDLTALLPDRRATRLEVRLDDSEPVRLEAHHPVGDSDHHPFTEETLTDKLTRLLDDRPLVDRLRRLCAALPDSRDAGLLLRTVSHTAAGTEAPAQGGDR